MSHLSPDKPGARETQDPSPVRAIVHLDLDAFFATVEMIENPDLQGKPIVVGGRPGERGVVATASYPARARGVRSAMPMSLALQRCPEAIVIAPHHALYQQYSQRVMALLRQASPLVEQMSIDEAYLDFTDLVSAWENSMELAGRLQRQVQEETGLSASLGVATNKLVAKIASDQNKPGGLTVVRPGHEASFLAPLPVRVLWGIGPRTADKLSAIGVTTVGELAERPVDQLREHFGNHGAEMARQARGKDPRPLVAARGRKSVSQERTFARDIVDESALKGHLWRMSRGVAQVLQRVHMAAGTVALKLRYTDFTTLTRQATVPEPTSDAREIYRAALVLLGRAWERNRPVRLLGVAGRNLRQPTGQLPLW